VQGHPYWNAVKIYYDPSTPNYDFKIAMVLDRWEFLPVVEYKFQSKRYDYVADVTVEYEVTEDLQALFSLPAEAEVNTAVPISEYSKTPAGTTITSRSWRMRKNSGAWSDMPWGGGDFTHVFPEYGTYDVELTVENDIGQVSSLMKSINIVDNSPNSPPKAAFDMPYESYEGHRVPVRNQSSDPDGEIVKVRYTTNASDYNKEFYPDTGNCVFVFNREGDYTVTQTVTDDRGATDSLTKGIEIKRTPWAIINQTGTLKQNRKIVFDSLKSIEHPDYPIDHSLDEWEIIPLGGMTADDIKEAAAPAGYKYILCKQPGQIKVRLRVTDTRGKQSYWTEATYTIAPDNPPIVKFDVVKTHLREKDLGGKAVIELTDATEYDGDYASVRRWSYAYDGDNDGDFTDETYTVFSDSNDSHPTLEVSDVGKYRFELYVKEDFGEETIPEFISPSDYQSGDTSGLPATDKTVEVINTAPIVSFVAKPKYKADVQFIVPTTLQTALNDRMAAFRADLIARGIDVKVNVSSHEQPADEGLIYLWTNSVNDKYARATIDNAGHGYAERRGILAEYDMATGNEVPYTGGYEGYNGNKYYQTQVVYNGFKYKLKKTTYITQKYRYSYYFVYRFYLQKYDLNGNLLEEYYLNESCVENRHDSDGDWHINSREYYGMLYDGSVYLALGAKDFYDKPVYTYLYNNNGTLRWNKTMSYRYRDGENTIAIVLNDGNFSAIAQLLDSKYDGRKGKWYDYRIYFPDIDTGELHVYEKNKMSNFYFSNPDACFISNSRIYVPLFRWGYYNTFITYDYSNKQIGSYSIPKGVKDNMRRDDYYKYMVGNCRVGDYTYIYGYAIAHDIFSHYTDLIGDMTWREGANRIIAPVFFDSLTYKELGMSLGIGCNGRYRGIYR